MLNPEQQVGGSRGFFACGLHTDNEESRGKNMEPRNKQCRRWDWLAGWGLFATTAAVVIWQNSRLGVLWDLSYILENAYRISLGQMPYRDFPLPYAPLTFVIQAALIKLTGRVFWHHVIYCALAGSAATLLTWRILMRVWRPANHARAAAFLLSVPLVVLGIYGIFPHPFYDCDCTLAVLVSVSLLLRAGDRRFPPALSLIAGMVAVAPALTKQNTGLAYLASTTLAMMCLLLINWRDARLKRGYVLVMSGIATGLLAAALVIHFTAGINNYRIWTVQFAAQRRMPAMADMLAVFDNRLLLWWVAASALGWVLLTFARSKRWLAIAAGVLMSMPFAWAVASLGTGEDAADRVVGLLSLWPWLLIVGLVAAAIHIVPRPMPDTAPEISGEVGDQFVQVLPFIAIATVEGAFLSQQVWGSTYALWPLAMLLLGSTLAVISRRVQQRWVLEIVLPAVIAGCLLLSGGYYVWSHERLDYASIGEGERQHSHMPALRGLTVLGPWLPQFDELARYAQEQIPAGDALLMIPGEDLFYYATGRKPQFPVLMFDRTVNPYSPEEIADLVKRRNMRWLVVKRDLQLNADPVEERARLMDLLGREFRRVEELDNYQVYRRE